MRTRWPILLASCAGVLFAIQAARPADDAATKDSFKPAAAAEKKASPGQAPKVSTEFRTSPGFEVERLYTVPKEEQGSWVSMATDNKGRLIVSDQNTKGLYRVTPPAIGSNEETKVEKLDAKITGAQGMLYAFDSLYVVVNHGRDSGLYRLRDTKGTDQFDEIVKLHEFHGPMGEHGPHAIKLSPDGKSLFIVCGNHTELPWDTIMPRQPSAADMQAHPEYTSRLPVTWDEDLILPRLWDPNGHAVGRMAPGGYIVQTDPEGKTWNMYSAGYRNCYDMDFNADGELFAYDSDMEWDMGLPWYRPTRLVHASAGSDFGWRSGAGDWPWYYVDSLAPAADMGPGSPVGVIFGYGTKFPAKYQRALFACDWTYGTIYAVTLEPEGSSYKAIKEEFLSRNALPLTDIVVGKDGALYFIVGGRNLQSELFRVRYVGPESTEPVDYHDSRNADQREIRHKLEALQRKVADTSKAVVDLAWPALGSSDRLLRFDARAALEFQPVELWQDKVLMATDPETLITGAVAIAHQADKKILPRLLEALNQLDFDKLTTFQQLELLRDYELAIIRLGPLAAAQQEALIKRLDAHYPGGNDLVNRELCNLLCALQSPTVVAKTMPLLAAPSPQVKEEFGDLLGRNTQFARPIAAMLEHHPDQQKIAYVYALRVVKAGWTPDQRAAFFNCLRELSHASGGFSFQKYLNNIGNEAYDNCTNAERLAIEAAGARKPYVPPVLPKPEGPTHDWTAEEVLQLATNANALNHRDFRKGRTTFAAARCIVCHRFGGDGGSTGPDLTQLAGRYSMKDLVQKISEPNKAISDQYRAKMVVTTGGKSYTGRVVKDEGGKIVLLTDPEDSTKTVTISRDEIEDMHDSPVSLMPTGLLKPLNEQEVLNLLAYLLSRGNPQDAMFAK
ncbi:MAG TPA: c-type cytochrome [Pirellulales bacterium]|jgi:putative heme-binding domain-containing protein|nr:c-type cytochrome [Pirellulales bacterium]